MRRAILLPICAAAALASPPKEPAMQLPFIWSDQTGARDMPWMGKGGRARWFVIDRTKPWDIMDPRGPKLETHWGSSGRAGESPYDTADRVVAFLGREGFLKPWPSYPSDSGQKGAIALPFRITIVAIQPTVAIIRFDLSAAIEDPIPFSFGAFPPSQRQHSELQGLGWSGTPNRVMFGTHLVDHGSLLWCSPEAGVPPTKLDLSGGRTEIRVQGVAYTLIRRNGELEVQR